MTMKMILVCINLFQMSATAKEKREIYIKMKQISLKLFQFALVDHVNAPILLVRYANNNLGNAVRP